MCKNKIEHTEYLVQGLGPESAQKGPVLTFILISWKSRRIHWDY